MKKKKPQSIQNKIRGKISTENKHRSYIKDKEESKSN